MKKNLLSFLSSTSLVLFFLIALYGSGEDKSEVKNDATTEEPTTQNNENEVESQPEENQTETNTEPSLAEKKVMCFRMFGGGDMSAWETAQAECMLNNSESACECMQVLSQ